MGFKFNELHSDDYGVYFKTETMPYIAPKRSEAVEVQGRDGQYVFEDGYDNIQIELACVIIGSKVLDRRKQARAAAAWLANTGILIFDYEQDMQYRVVKVTNDIASAMVGTADEFTIVFECEPYQEQSFYTDAIPWEDAAIAWKYANFPWEGYPRTFEVSAGSSIDVTNAGTYKALPVVVLTGVATTVTIGGFTFNNLNGTVYIDSKNMLVYSLSGSTKVNRLADFSGDFPVLDPGTNTLAISGTITSLTLEFDYKNTYL